jgi:hypothetical protein
VDVAAQWPSRALSAGTDAERVTKPGPASEAIRGAKTRVERDIAIPGLGALSTAYYDPARGFAGATFDTLGANPRNEITRDDLLAATLLDVRWSPSAVRRLLGEDARPVTDLLVGISSVVNLWEASDQRLAGIDPLRKLLMRCSDGVGRAHASKLLARKRPRLVPVTDKIIVAWSGTIGQTWQALRYCLQDESLRQAIETLRPRQATTASVLRLLDVALWMLHSESRAARNAREAVGVTPER